MLSDHYHYQHNAAFYNLFCCVISLNLIIFYTIFRKKVWFIHVICWIWHNSIYWFYFNDFRPIFKADVHYFPRQTKINAYLNSCWNDKIFLKSLQIHFEKWLRDFELANFGKLFRNWFYRIVLYQFMSIIILLCQPC